METMDNSSYTTSFPWILLSIMFYLWIVCLSLKFLFSFISPWSSDCHAVVWWFSTSSFTQGITSVSQSVFLAFENSFDDEVAAALKNHWASAARG